MNSSQRSKTATATLVRVRFPVSEETREEQHNLKIDCGDLVIDGNLDLFVMTYGGWLEKVGSTSRGVVLPESVTVGLASPTAFYRALAPKYWNIVKIYLDPAVHKAELLAAGAPAGRRVHSSFVKGSPRYFTESAEGHALAL